MQWGRSIARWRRKFRSVSPDQKLDNLTARESKPRHTVGVEYGGWKPGTGAHTMRAGASSKNIWYTFLLFVAKEQVLSSNFPQKFTKLEPSQVFDYPCVAVALFRHRRP